jgi:hypothetical protein
VVWANRFAGTSDLEVKMVERFELLFATLQTEAASSGWFSEQWALLMTALSEKQAWEALTNPYLIGLSAVLFLMGLFLRKTKLIILVVAAWGYIGTYRFSIGGKTAGDVAFDMNAGTVADFGELLTFFVGFVIVTGVVLYLGFVKGD